jgi:hypothetical protein
MKSRGIFLLALSTLIVTGCELGSHPVNYGGDTLFFDDFYGYNNFDVPSNWEFVDDPGCFKGPSSWYVYDTYNDAYDMALYQASEIYYGGYGQDNAYFGTSAYAGQDSWTDYRLTCDFFTGGNDGIGIDFRVDNGLAGDGFYRLFFVNDPTNGGPFTKLIKYNKTTDTFALLASTTETYEPNRWYEVEIEVVGTNIKCYVDGILFFDLSDANSIQKGKIGLFCYYNKDVFFDNVKVLALDENGNEGNRLF